MDKSGEFHSLFNLGQALHDGTNWKPPSHVGKAGELEVEITWNDDKSGPKPTILLKLRPSAVGKAPAEPGIAHLDELFWDHLFGPEPFELREGVALLLPSFGRPFAVAAVTKTPCAAE